MLERACRRRRWRSRADFWPGPLTIIGESARGDTGDRPRGRRHRGPPLPRPPADAGAAAKVRAASRRAERQPLGRAQPQDGAGRARYFDGKIDAVIDGGECGIGTESSIITLAARAVSAMLRQGRAGRRRRSRRGLAAGYVHHRAHGRLRHGEDDGARARCEGLGALCIDADEVYHELLGSSSAAMRGGASRRASARGCAVTARLTARRSGGLSLQTPERWPSSTPSRTST